jgi:hypothetical protein
MALDSGAAETAVPASALAAIGVPASIGASGASGTFDLSFSIRKPERAFQRGGMQRARVPVEYHDLPVTPPDFRETLLPFANYGHPDV